MACTVAKDNLAEVIDPERRYYLAGVVTTADLAEAGFRVETAGYMEGNVVKPCGGPYPAMFDPFRMFAVVAAKHSDVVVRYNFDNEHYDRYVQPESNQDPPPASGRTAEVAYNAYYAARRFPENTGLY